MWRNEARVLALVFLALAGSCSFSEEFLNPLSFGHELRLREQLISVVLKKKVDGTARALASVAAGARCNQVELPIGAARGDRNEMVKYERVFKNFDGTVETPTPVTLQDLKTPLLI